MINEENEIAGAIHQILKEKFIGEPMLEIGFRIMNSFNIKYLGKIYTVQVKEVLNLNITQPIEVQQ